MKPNYTFWYISSLWAGISILKELLQLNECLNFLSMNLFFSSLLCQGAVPKGNATKEFIESLQLKPGQVVYKCPKCCSIKPDRAHHCRYSFLCQCVHFRKYWEFPPANAATLKMVRREFCWSLHLTVLMLLSLSLAGDSCIHLCLFFFSFLYLE